MYFDNVHCTGLKSKPVLDGFLKSEGQIPIGYQHKLYKHLLSIFKTFKELLMGILTSLVLRKYDFFRVFEITGTGVSLIL